MQKLPQLVKNSKNIHKRNILCSFFSVDLEVYFFQKGSGSEMPILLQTTIVICISVLVMGPICFHGVIQQKPVIKAFFKLMEIASTISSGIFSRVHKPKVSRFLSSFPIFLFAVNLPNFPNFTLINLISKSPFSMTLNSRS